MSIKRAYSTNINRQFKFWTSILIDNQIAYFLKIFLCNLSLRSPILFLVINSKYWSDRPNAFLKKLITILVIIKMGILVVVLVVWLLSMLNNKRVIACFVITQISKDNFVNCQFVNYKNKNAVKFLSKHLYMSVHFKLVF